MTWAVTFANHFYHNLFTYFNFLQRGYQTVATVRSPPKAEAILQLHPEWNGKVELVYVQDIVAPGAFDEVIESEEIEFDYIIHTASPVSFSVDDVKKDLIDPAIHGYVAFHLENLDLAKRSVTVQLSF